MKKPAPKPKINISTIIQNHIDKHWGKEEDWGRSIGCNQRFKAREMIYNAFFMGLGLENNENREQEEMQIEILSWLIEQKVYESFFVFRYPRYAAQIRYLFTYIKKDPLKFRKLDPAFVATMSVSEMASDSEEFIQRHSIPFIKEHHQKDIFNSKSEYQCRKCRGWDVHTYCMQKRSGDEPADVYIVCLNPLCKARRKERG